jgi:hypothetical protein
MILYRARDQQEVELELEPTIDGADLDMMVVDLQEEEGQTIHFFFTPASAAEMGRHLLAWANKRFASTREGTGIQK